MTKKSAIVQKNEVKQSTDLVTRGEQVIFQSNSPRFQSGIIPDTEMAGLTQWLPMQLISVSFFRFIRFKASSRTNDTDQECRQYLEMISFPKPSLYGMGPMVHSTSRYGLPL